MNDIIKQHAVSGSALVFAVIMGLQNFIFGNGGLESLKKDVVALSDRIEKLESPKKHE